MQRKVKICEKHEIVCASLQAGDIVQELTLLVIISLNNINLLIIAIALITTCSDAGSKPVSWLSCNCMALIDEIESVPSVAVLIHAPFPIIDSPVA